MIPTVPGRRPRIHELLFTWDGNSGFDNWEVRTGSPEDSLIIKGYGILKNAPIRLSGPIRGNPGYSLDLVNVTNTNSIAFFVLYDYE
jgi:hypothetical protein